MPHPERDDVADGAKETLLDGKNGIEISASRKDEAQRRLLAGSPAVARMEEKTGPLPPVVFTVEDGIKPKKDDHQIVKSKHPTSFIETLIHLLKGNIGSGMFAMGDAFKNAGMIAGPILTLFLGVVCIYNNHVLVNCSMHMKEKKKLPKPPNFPETVELCFENGPPRFRKWTMFVRKTVKVFIINTQLGFCCVYFVFVSSTLQHVLTPLWMELDVRVYMAAMFVPVLGSCLIRSLKFLAPVSLLSNLFVGSSVFLTLYLVSSDLPSPASRPAVAPLAHLPLFFGTTIYSFEGIALILPLQNEMKKPEQFDTPLGVLNIGLSIVTALLITVGFIGFLKFGDDVKDSLSLNLPDGDTFSICVQFVLALGIVFSYALQFYVAADLIWADVHAKWGPFSRPILAENILKTLLVLLTLALAAVIPRLGLFISLIGAVCSTALALVYPALCDIAVRCCPLEEGPLLTPGRPFRLAMDALTLIIALFGFVTGTYFSVKNIVLAFFV